MKRFLVASGCFAMVSLLHHPRAHAQGFPVIDVANIGQSIINETKEVAEMIQEYDIAVDEWNALAHGNAILSVAPGLLSAAIQLPGSSSNLMPGLTFGSSLSGFGGQFFNQNHYYTPQGNDFEAQEILRGQQATANIQGEALQGMQMAEQRIGLLQQLQADIQNQQDVTAVASAAAHINSEHTILANEQAKIQRLQLMAQMQDRVDQQRAEQEGRKEDEDYSALAAAYAFGQ